MSAAAFDSLVSILRPQLEADQFMGSKVGGAISVESQVAMTIRWLSGASYLDLFDVHGVSRSTLYMVTERVVDAIISSSSVGTMKWPSSSVSMSDCAAAFKARSSLGVLKHCIGTVDGLFISIRAPARAETDSVRRFYSGHKCGFGLNLQAICDADCRFIGASCNTPGSTNDVVAWDHSAFSKLTTTIPYPYFIVGDAAYKLLPALITPYIGKNLESAEDNFNFFQSQLRITVERSFGLLVCRWGILWKPLRCSLKKAPKIVEVCIRLHNFCLDHGESGITLQDDLQADRPVVSGDGSLQPVGRWQTSFFAASATSSGGGAARRNQLKADVQKAKLCRPVCT